MQAISVEESVAILSAEGKVTATDAVPAMRIP